MAATPGLTGRRGAAPAVLGVGPFGDRVAELLAGAIGGRSGDGVLRPASVGEAFAGPADIVVLALWRPSPALCERTDELSFLTGRPWLPVVMDHPELRVGPLVHPPSAPCYRCYRRRQIQHDAQHDVTAALHAAYDSGPALGPRGYLPHQARAAAALAAGIVAQSRRGRADGTAPVGLVWSSSLTDLNLASARVLPCHDCPRCAPDEAADPLGRIEELALGLRGARREAVAP